MNAIEKLLKADKGLLKLPSKEFEIARLSKIIGEEFIVNIQGIDGSALENIRDLNSDIETGMVNLIKMRKDTILEAVKSPNLRDKSYMEQLGAATPYDLINAIFLPGEQDAIYAEVQKLSGFGDDAVVEVKN